MDTQTTHAHAPFAPESFSFLSGGARRQVCERIEVPLGLYGPRGWTSASGIFPLLKRHAKLEGKYPLEGLIDGELMSGFIRFNHLDGAGAGLLRKRIPVENLTDRQNQGPSLLSLLSLAERFPTRIFLSGYVIGQARPDERVTVDGIRIYDPDPAAKDWAGERAQTWVNPMRVRKLPVSLFERIAKQYCLVGHSAPPDEFEAVGRRGKQPAYWWIWWD